MTGEALHSGSCLCGAVRYVVRGAIPPPDACHCRQCRRQSGHYWASTDIERDNFALEGAENLRWYQSSGKVRRGFCGTCGSLLLWDVPGRARIGVSMGSFDEPTGTQLAVHIFTAEKGDYYAIVDGLPQE